jgi:hypothetical protein
VSLMWGGCKANNVGGGGGFFVLLLGALPFVVVT